MIVLYNSNDERIGNIFPRRAKQLVLKGRAIWLEEGQSVKIAESSTFTKEEKSMTDEKLSNGTPYEPPYTAVPHDETLLEQAKKNLAARRNLLKLLAFNILAWVLLLVAYDVIFTDLSHPRAWQINNAQNHLAEVETQLNAMLNAGTIGQNTFNNLTSSISNADNALRWVSNTHVSPIFYVLMGVMLMWSAWTAMQIVKYLANSPFRISKRQDSLTREYHRLKRIALEE
ncbi:MAG: hypothetical protein FWG65_03095 [Turicibacter sp.]|nr:hypothetical protein [Turicibacter sp.]